MVQQGIPSNEKLQQIEEDLSVIHSFYLFLLESAFGHEIPVPGLIAHETDALYRFVLLLDKAVTPQMIRDGLKDDDQREAAEALLRFFALKPQRQREDRDKIDVIATAIYRPRALEDAGEWGQFGNDQATLDFEKELWRIYRGTPMPEPANEHMQLVREFGRLRVQVDGFQNFDELIESGIIQKVHDMKQALSGSFMQPRVLSVLAAYNLFFSQRFDALFNEAAKDVKSFVEKVQRDGGSLMSSEDANAIAKHLAPSASASQPAAPKAEKEKPKEKDKGPAKTEAPGVVKPQTKGPKPAESAFASRPVAPTGANEPPGFVMPRSSASVAEIEAQELQAVQQAIRSFVRTADADSAHVVPLPHGNITLTNAEVEAFRAEFADEKSFRSDFAASLMQMAALDARLLAQLQEFEKTKHTTYNWKPHADALAHLLSTGGEFADHAMELAGLAAQRGLNDKSVALSESVEKVRPRGRAAAEALQSIATKSE